MTIQPFSDVPEQLQQQFQQLGEDLGLMMLEQFKTALSSQQQGIEKALEVLVQKQRNRILKQVQRELEKQFSLQLGAQNGLVNNVIESIIPSVIDRMSGNASKGTPIIPSYVKSQQQSFGQLGRFLRLYSNRH